MISRRRLGTAGMIAVAVSVFVALFVGHRPVVAVSFVMDTEDTHFCVGELLPASVLVKVRYRVEQPPVSIEKLRVDVTIYEEEPDKLVFIRADSVGDTFTSTTRKETMLRICFTISQYLHPIEVFGDEGFAAIEPDRVEEVKADVNRRRITFDIKYGVDANDPLLLHILTKANTTVRIDDIDAMIADLSVSQMRLSQMQSELLGQRQVDFTAAYDELHETNSGLIIMYSVSLVFIVGSTVWQYIALKKYFKSRHYVD